MRIELCTNLLLIVLCGGEAAYPKGLTNIGSEDRCHLLSLLLIQPTCPVSVFGKLTKRHQDWDMAWDDQDPHTSVLSTSKTVACTK